MDLLLDTSAFIWAIRESRKLGPTAQAALVSPENTIYVSAASVWEIAIKRKLGKLELPGATSNWISESNFRDLPISADHASAAGDLPLLHRDPFDRMLVAQAQVERLTLVAHDDDIARYAVPMLDARL